MRIVLAGALPDAQPARELGPHLVEAAPTLVQWLERSRAHRIVADPAQTYCTALEYWQLRQCGFLPRDDERWSAGLGPLHATGAATDEPVWLLELAHLSPSRDGAVLIPAQQLGITSAQSVALFESAHSVFADTGFSLQAADAHTWRVTLPDGYRPACASPALVSITTVNDWWTQDPAGRAWRRLSNELQMLWFDHPVNQMRADHGQAPINGVWLYGGAYPSQLAVPAQQALADAHIDDRLAGAVLAQDWGGWLAALKTLEDDVLTGLDTQPAEIILTGRDQLLTLTPEKRLWARWRPGARDSWKKWWSYPN